MTEETAGTPVRSGPPAPGTKPAGLFSRPYAGLTAGITAVMFLTGFAALAVVPTLPVAARELEGVSLFPLVAGCFVAASLLGGVLGGTWADRAGARRPLAAGTLLAVLTLVVSGLSDSVWQLAAGRFLDGLAAGMTAVAVNAAVAQNYPDELRPRALSLLSTCWIVPSLVGPPVAGLVAETWSWRTVFLGLAVLTALPALAVLLLLRERGGSVPYEKTNDAGESAHRPGLLVAVAVSVGAALGQYAASGWDLAHLLYAVAALAVLGVFAPRLLPPGTLRAGRGLPASVLLRGLTSGVFFTLEAFVPLMLLTVREVPAVVTGLAFTGAAVFWAGAAWVQSRWLGRFPRHRVVIAGALLLAAAVVLALVGTLPSVPAATAAPAMVVAAIGMGLLAPSLTLLSLHHTPPDRQGYASAAMQTTQNLGQIAVLGVASALFNAVLVREGELPGYAGAFALLLVPTALVVLLAGRARADAPRTRTPSPPTASPA
ncbi:MFS transporter [Streptomyces sp. NPDC087440]|uniref:MFS transporter n=1 Tax=Streptomyces sp. NPDC087440 TaxID=3365790 RepID=UPI003812A7CA